jgi:hypothetical protein
VRFRGEGRAAGRPEPSEVNEHLAFLHAATVRIGGDLELAQVVIALCETTVPRVADLAATYLYDAVLTEGDLPDAPTGDSELRKAAITGGGGRTRDRTLVEKIAVSALTGPFASAVSSGQL